LAASFFFRPFNSAAALSDFSGRHEMKDEGSGDAGRDGNNSAPSPVRENAQGQYQPALPKRHHLNFTR